MFKLKFEKCNFVHFFWQKKMSLLIFIYKICNNSIIFLNTFQKNGCNGFKIQKGPNQSIQLYIVLSEFDLFYIKSLSLDKVFRIARNYKLNIVWIQKIVFFLIFVAFLGIYDNFKANPKFVYNVVEVETVGKPFSPSANSLRNEISYPSIEYLLLDIIQIC